MRVVFCNSGCLFCQVHQLPHSATSLFPQQNWPFYFGFFPRLIISRSFFLLLTNYNLIPKRLSFCLLTRELRVSRQELVFAKWIVIRRSRRLVHFCCLEDFLNQSLSFSFLIFPICLTLYLVQLCKSRIWSNEVEWPIRLIASPSSVNHILHWNRVVWLVVSFQIGWFGCRCIQCPHWLIVLVRRFHIDRCHWSVFIEDWRQRCVSF